MQDLLAGAIVMAFSSIGVFFLRFWRKTGDSLFACFAVAFLILALERLLLEVIPHTDELRPLIYTQRLLAFALILVGIIVKNRAA